MLKPFLVICMRDREARASEAHRGMLARHTRKLRKGGPGGSASAAERRAASVAEVLEKHGNSRAVESAAERANRDLRTSAGLPVHFLAKDLYSEAKGILDIAAADTVARLEKGETVGTVLTPTSSFADMEKVIVEYLQVRTRRDGW